VTCTLTFVVGCRTELVLSTVCLWLQGPCRPCPLLSQARAETPNLSLLFLYQEERVGMPSARQSHPVLLGLLECGGFGRESVNTIDPSRTRILHYTREESSLADER